MKQKTKSKIIEKATELFNEHGYENVSMRDISECLSISPGNLTYHYKKKTDILYEIIQLLMKEYKKKQYTPEITLSEFNDILLEVSDHQSRYAFYYRNIVELQKKYSWIASVQADFTEEYTVLIRDMLRCFVKNSWLREECRENMFEDLSLAILSIITFWTQFNMSRDMTDVVWSLLLPYLTEKGENEYQKIAKNDQGR